MGTRPIPRVIGLYSSVPQCGKTTIANWIRTSPKWRAVKFATPLKNMIRQLLRDFGTTPENIEHFVEGEGKHESLMQFGERTTRYLMQTLGTEWGRETIDSDIWVNAAMSQVLRLLDRGFNVVIDDMRFPNEYDGIKEIYETEVWRVERPSARVEEGHESEGQLDDHDFDLLILNDTDSVDGFKVAADRQITRHFNPGVNLLLAKG